MPVTIPLRGNLPNLELQADLDGTVWTLRIRWNERAAAYFCTVYSADGQTLLLGDRRMGVDFPIAPYVTGRSPPGALMLVDTSGQGLDPRVASLFPFASDLGARVKLLYYSLAELGL